MDGRASHLNSRYNALVLVRRRHVARAELPRLPDPAPRRQGLRLLSSLLVIRDQVLLLLILVVVVTSLLMLLLLLLLMVAVLNTVELQVAAVPPVLLLHGPPVVGHVADAHAAVGLPLRQLVGVRVVVAVRGGRAVAVVVLLGGGRGGEPGHPELVPPAAAPPATAADVEGLLLQQLIPARVGVAPGEGSVPEHLLVLLLLVVVVPRAAVVLRPPVHLGRQHGLVVQAALVLGRGRPDLARVEVDGEVLR